MSNLKVTLSLANYTKAQERYQAALQAEQAANERAEVADKALTMACADMEAMEETIAGLLSKVNELRQRNAYLQAVANAPKVMNCDGSAKYTKPAAPYQGYCGVAGSTKQAIENYKKVQAVPPRSVITRGEMQALHEAFEDFI